jgi:hypothetical protein
LSLNFSSICCCFLIASTNQNIYQTSINPSVMPISKYFTSKSSR